MCLHAGQRLADTYKVGQAAALCSLTKHAICSLQCASEHSSFDETQTT